MTDLDTMVDEYSSHLEAAYAEIAQLKRKLKAYELQQAAPDPDADVLGRILEAGPVERCGKHIDTLSEWRVTCGLPKDHAGHCVVIAIGGGGAGDGGSAPRQDHGHGTISFDIGPHGRGCGPIRAALEAILPRDAFEAGFFAAGDRWARDEGWCPEWLNEKTAELAWEHFQAERMKAAASTEGESK